MDNNTLSLPLTELSAGGKIYLLKLTALAAVRMEERLGISLYDIIRRSDEVKMTAELLYTLIESSRPEFTKAEVYDVMDDFISGGGTLKELNTVIAEALGNSGFFGRAPAARES